MKLSLLRPSLLMAVALGLTACGGKATFDLTGPVTGLVYEGLVLSNTKNGDEVAVAANATTFKLPKTVEYGSEYAVIVKTDPEHQECLVQNGAETAGRLASVNITVRCKLDDYKIGGAVSGLTTEGLVLINGSGDQVTIAKGATSYTFDNEVKFKDSYGVTVFKQPEGQRCSVANGVGEMGDAAVTNINITCGLG